MSDKINGRPIRACPFCGCQNIFTTIMPAHITFGCPDCGNETWGRNTDSKALERWNRRAGDMEAAQSSKPLSCLRAEHSAHHSPHPPVERCLHAVVRRLSDGWEWNWTRIHYNDRHAADDVLGMMAAEGLIEQRMHPLGGLIWKLGDKLYGRTDNLTTEKFEKLKAA